jgi:hypothetical protein
LKRKDATKMRAPISMCCHVQASTNSENRVIY